MEAFSWKDELFSNISAQIDRFGWSVVYVGGDGCMVPGCAGDHDSDLVGPGLPRYGYTVGLPFRFAHAELVLVGFDRERAARTLNAIGDAVEHGARLSPGNRLEIDGMPIRVGSCAVSRVRDGLVAVSFEYHNAIGTHSLPNPMQILWPDSAGRFPGDPLLDREVRRSQPDLSRRAPRDRAHWRPRRASGAG